jgi:hypothetical protein
LNILSHFDLAATKNCPTMPDLEESTEPPRLVKQPAEASSKHDEVLARLLHGKEKEWSAIAEKTGPLQLLDLPIDILKEIVNHITHTNDLTSLALTHSALHALAIPQIYSRFDIVWPDAHAAVDNRSGVDALTYGLATLVMAQDVFGEASSQRIPNHQYHKCGQCGWLDRCSHSTNVTRGVSDEFRSPGADRKAKIRRGNNFAEFTRKFSLGNGPADWVQEYQINKEGGKMLGTLVALAVGRMRNLETFIWDMPTGILRDIWLALASLGDRDDGQDCRLERIWVRWHDNSDVPSPTLPTVPMATNPILVPPTSTSTAQPPVFVIPPYPRVEFPTFSILPPLKSLSVLDIDELPYAEEMSVLLERSVHKLRELRLGIAQHAHLDDWVRPLEDQVHGAPLNGDNIHPASRPAGILGLLVSRFCDVFRPIDVAKGSPDPFEDQKNFEISSGLPPALISAMDVPPIVQAELEDSTPSAAGSKQPGTLHNFAVEAPSLLSNEGSVPSLEAMTASFAAQNLERAEVAPPLSELQPSGNTATNNSTSDLIPVEAPHAADDLSATPRPTSNNTSNDRLPGQAELSLGTLNTLLFPECHEERTVLKLKLEVLELERVPISIQVLSQAIDWSRLTCLTILGCRNHEQLWKALRKQFSPSKRSSSSSGFSNGMRQSTPGRPFVECSSGSRFRASTGAQETTPGMTYHSFPLIIRRLHTDAVSPALIAFIRDTLPPDSLENLFLQEGLNYKTTVTMDAIYRGALRRHRRSLKKLLVESEDKSEDGPPHAWRRWIFNREVLSFITSGQMPSLRELGMAIDYKDWHFFLQRLPHATQLRSLFIPYVADHVHGRSDSRELGMQVLDIVALRPELELCYLGIQSKCFEILEYPKGRRPSVDYSSAAGAGDSGASDDEDGGHSQAAAAQPENHGDDTDSEVSSSRDAETDAEDDHMVQGTRQFKLREILFYDDKVSIFKARHGRL